MLDCDPGLDDALAILLALGSPKIDVKAIIATFGNVGLNQTKTNLLRILSFFEKIPLIGFGSQGPLKGKAVEARYVHGKDGLGDLSDPSQLRSGPIGPLRKWTEVKQILFKEGVGLIIDLAFSNKIERIITTGPLTDLARAISRQKAGSAMNSIKSGLGGRKGPALLETLEEVVIMGGAVFVKGNVTPYAEFNFHCDPEAARQVLNAAVKKRLVSLDVTHKTLLTAQHLKPLRDIKSPLARFICCIADYSIRSNKKRGNSGAPMHDPLAVAIAIDPKIGKYKELCLDVETKGKGRGKVLVKRGSPNTLFCKSVNVDKFFKLFIGALTKLAKGIDKG